jgi:hypothetical protein
MNDCSGHGMQRTRQREGHPAIFSLEDINSAIFMTAGYEFSIRGLSCQYQRQKNPL